MDNRLVNDVKNRIMEKLSADSNVLSKLWSGDKKLMDAITESLPTLGNLAGKETKGNILYDIDKSISQGQYNPLAISKFLSSPGAHGNYRASFGNDTTSIPRAMTAGIAGDLASVAPSLATLYATGNPVAALAAMIPARLLGHRVGYDVRNALDSALGPSSGGVLGAPDAAYRALTDTPASKLEAAKSFVGAPLTSTTTSTRLATGPELRERLGI